MLKEQSRPLQDMSLKQLEEMNAKAKRLCELMKKGIVQFIYKKKSTGKIRKAKGTLKRDLIPPEAQRKKGRPKKRPKDLVIYYDTEKQAIRSFKDYLLQKIYSKSSNISKSGNIVDSSNNKGSQEKQVNKTNDKKPSSTSKKLSALTKDSNKNED